MNIESSYNFRRLSARLTTSGVVRREALQALGQQGYQVVVNLLPETSEHALADERSIVEAQGLEYIHIPVDFKRPTAEDFARFAAALERVADQKTHVHCAANFRVSAFYSRYQVERGAWTVAQARELIAGLWRPQDYPGWPEFIADILKEP